MPLAHSQQRIQNAKCRLYLGRGWMNDHLIISSHITKNNISGFKKLLYDWLGINAFHLDVIKAPWQGADIDTLVE